MKPKPDYLTYRYASVFKEQGIVDAYKYRHLYPPETFEILSQLISEKPRTVLDIGCGTGNIALNLINHADHIDAVDFSEAMIDKGKKSPGGDDPRINWICSSVEKAELNPPYTLITAGESLHWMEWDIVFKRFGDVLTPKGFLAIIDCARFEIPWHDKLREILTRYTTNPRYEAYNLIEELESRRLFQKCGQRNTAPVPFTQSVVDYIEMFHSVSCYSRERMGKIQSKAFDTEIRKLVSEYCHEKSFIMKVQGVVVWGRPQRYSNYGAE